MSGAVLVALWLTAGISAAWLGFAYLGYPLGLLLLRAVSPRRALRADIAPPISIIIAVHNGERALGAKLEATLKLPYPLRPQIIVASDGSTDGSVAIAERYADRGVQLAHSPARQGKEAAQARGIAIATGEILIFTDVGAELSPDALREIVQPFADPQIGAVSSEDEVESVQADGMYVRYEMALRQLESEATTLIGLSGSLFALRRELTTPWPIELASDFRSALETARRGWRAVSEPRARARYGIVDDPGAEWRRKVRIVRRGLAVLFAYRELLDPRHGRTAYTLIGHKLARFTTPFALLGLLLSCALGAADSGLLAAALLPQVLGHGLGGAALFHRPLLRFRLARWAAFFVLVHASMLVAWLYHWSGQRAVTWAPTAR